jgi:CRISPR-associated endonuclease/helicase Cas3
VTYNNTPTTTDAGLSLPGLDGSNPLGFLAALGVLRTLSDNSELKSVRMKWVPAGGTWIPAIHGGSCDPVLDSEAIVEALSQSMAIDIDEHPTRLLKVLGTDDEGSRRQIFLEQLGRSSGETRTWVDWLAALASDFAPADAINQLQTTRRDYYYPNLTSVMKSVGVDHLRRSIVRPWDYGDPLDNQSLHMDPTEDRRHAHQWNKPAGDPDRKKSGGMLGANRLAIEAIPLFTSFPEHGTLRTVGFTGNRSTNTRWTWPLWSVWLSLPVIRSLLLLPELQGDSVKPDDISELRARGVAAVYRTNRILVGKTPNFTPPRRIA